MGPRLQSETIFQRRQPVTGIRNPAGVSEGCACPAMPRLARGVIFHFWDDFRLFLISPGLYVLRRPLLDFRCPARVVGAGKSFLTATGGHGMATGCLEVGSDSVHPALPTSGTRVGPGWSCALQWISVDGPIHYPPPQDVLSGTMFILFPPILFQSTFSNAKYTSEF